MQDGEPAARPQPHGNHGRRKRFLPYVAGAMVGLVLLVPASSLLTPTSVPIATVPPDGDVVDPADPHVSASSFDAILVHLNTDRPYTGSGPPGIRFVVDSPSDVVGWTFEAWANATVPPANPQFCASKSIRFDPNDWRAVSSGPGTGGDMRTVFETFPTTDSNRLGPNGDQCLVRANNVGVWRITICIEGEPVSVSDNHGRPKGIYDANDGRRHIDNWDSCPQRLVQVPV